MTSCFYWLCVVVEIMFLLIFWLSDGSPRNTAHNGSASQDVRAGD